MIVLRMGGFLNTALVSVLILFGMAASSQAHELQPGYLELRLIDKDLYSVTWKVPATRGRPMAMTPTLPENCNPPSPGQLAWDGSAYVARWNAHCPGGLEGGLIQIKGLDKTSTDVLVRFDFADGANEAHRLTPDNPSFTVPTQPNPFEVTRTYTILGIQHILEGVDHLLFVACLMLVAGISRKLVITITGFTIAHSVTLALATLDIVRIPVPPIEAAIALSIVFLATEIARRKPNSLTYKYPVAVSASFGLLHGFGFAAVLNQIGLPKSDVSLALLFFNIGVELGQLLFIASLIVVYKLLIYTIKALSNNFVIAFAKFETPAAYVIGILACYWTLQRIAAF